MVPESHPNSQELALMNTTPRQNVPASNCGLLAGARDETSKPWAIDLYTVIVTAGDKNTSKPHTRKSRAMAAPRALPKAMGLSFICVVFQFLRFRVSDPH
jgi:hypothetical protein